MKKWILFIFWAILANNSLIGQVPAIAFNRDLHSVNISVPFSKLNNIEGNQLSSIFTHGLKAGYYYEICISRWYSISTGLSAGWQNYGIHPNDAEYEYYASKSRVTIIELPFSVKKYYPFNNKHGLYVKLGITLSKVISSLSNFGAVEIDGQSLYETKAEINSIPQLGILFGLGGTYTFKSNNFISYGVFVVNKCFSKSIHVNYSYYAQTSSEYENGKLETSELFVGLSLAYNFKKFINE